MELFEEPSREVSPAHAPLAERMRPSTLQEFVARMLLQGILRFSRLK
jgi:replication-associated recombination protein RarA